MELLNLFLEQARRTPDKAALFCEGRSLTYGELSRFVRRWSFALAAAGVQRGEAVGVALPNVPEFVALMLVAADLRLALVPVPPALPGDALVQAFQATDVRHLIVTGEVQAKLAAAGGSFPGLTLVIDPAGNGASPTLDALLAGAPDDPPPMGWGEDDAPFILTMTSGSTGAPKPIVLTQRTKRERALAAVAMYQVTEADVTLAATPLYHSLAERLVLIPLLTGGTSVVMARFTAREWISAVSQHQVSFSIAVSSQLAQIARALSEQDDVSSELGSLRCVVSSSALLERGVKDELCRWLRCALHECYGASEIAIATNLDMAAGGAKLNSVGRAPPGVDVRILADDGTFAPPDVVGEIICRTPLIFGGYFRRPEMTSEAMWGEFFRTGDVGRMDEDGFLYMMGRKKEIIITGGINVYPADVETALIGYPGIGEVAAFAMPDERLGEVVAIAYVPDGAEPIDLRGLRHHCARRLADFQQPRQFFALTALPRNGMGKLVRHALPAMCGKAGAPATEPRPQAARQAGPLMLGFIGGAVNSAVGRAHYSASGLDNIWRVAAGCFSRHAEINRETAQLFGVPVERLYDDWRILLAAERERLDAMVVLTPTPDHAEMVEACLQQGVPVICEKALATSSAEARRILDLRDRTHGFLAVTYNYTGYPMVRELRHLIRNGTLGKLVSFQMEMPQEGFIRTDAAGNRPAPQPWRLSDSKIPTLHLDLAVHLHQILVYLTGAQPTSVAAIQASHGWFPGIVDDAMCLCRCEGGLYGHLWFSKSALGHRNGLRVRIQGTKAAAEWFQGEPEELRLSHDDGRREIRDRASQVVVAADLRTSRFKAGHPAGFIEAFANIYQDIAACLRHYKATGAMVSDEIFGAELALGGLLLVEAINKSAGLERWCDVGEGNSRVDG